MGAHRGLDLPHPLRLPAAPAEEVGDDLAGPELLGHLGRLLGQDRHLVGEPRSHAQPDSDEGEEQEEVDDADRQRAPAAARKPAFDHAHDGKDQVREEQGEDEQQQRLPEHVHEAEARHEDGDGPRDPRGAGIEEEHPPIVYPASNQSRGPPAVVESHS